jgi:hypothetical protein
MSNRMFKEKLKNDILQKQDLTRQVEEYIAYYEKK